MAGRLIGQVVGACLVGMLLAGCDDPSPAAAPGVSLENERADPREVGGRLDIVRISHGRDGDQLWHEVTTSRAWPSALMEEPNEIGLELSTDDDRNVDYIVSVFVAKGQLRADLTEYSGGYDFGSIGETVRIGVARPTPRSIRFSLGLFDLATPPASYEWLAYSHYKPGREGGCAGLCVDYAPDKGRLTHDISSGDEESS